jgi:hypothetical protein
LYENSCYVELLLEHKMQSTDVAFDELAGTASNYKWARYEREKLSGTLESENRRSVMTGSYRGTASLVDGHIGVNMDEYNMHNIEKRRPNV